MLTDEERLKVRHALGYLNVGSAATFVLGVPAALQTTFMIEKALDLILPEAEPEVRRHLSILDRIEAQLIDDLELLAVESIDEIKVRRDEQDALWDQYDRWRRSLANIFGVIPNPWDKRFENRGINVPVRG